MARIADLETRVAELECSRAELATALNRLGEALGQSHDRGAIVSAVLEASVLVMRARSAVFFVTVAGSDHLKPREVVGPVAGAGEVALGHGLAGLAASSGTVVVWDGDRGGASAGRPADTEPTDGSEPAIACPVRPGDRPFGVLALYGRTVGRGFSTNDTQTLQTLVRQVETAIENTFLYEEATLLSITDGLTGLWNRRHFDLRMGEELQRAARFGEPFGVLMTDLDHFKNVNDSHGHQVGDAVLVEVAARLSGSTREVDEVARFGLGDEFTLLLPKTGLAGSLRLAEKVRQAIAAQPFSAEAPPGKPALALTLTSSVGVAACPEHGTSAKHLVDAADEALRRAKARGGNCVEHAKTLDR